MTRAGILRRFALAASCLAAIPASMAAEEFLGESGGVRVSNFFFEVVADDMLSAQYAANVGEIMARRFSRMLPAPGPVSRPVAVNLAPAASQAGEAAFSTRIYPSGQVNVSISWGPATSRDMVERALAQGHLTYLSGAYSARTVTVPLWLELAVQHLARAQAVPAHRRFLAREVLDGRPMRLDRILLAERGEGMDDELGPHAYWLLQFLEREERGERGQFRNFLIRLLHGEAPMVAMNAAFGEVFRSAADAEMWWLVGVNELIRAPASPMLPVDVSRRRVKELSRFAFRLEGGESRLFVEDLWERRASASLQDELRRRSRVARMEVSSIHPFYHNVLLTLDRVFQAVLEADKQAYREAIIDLHHDLRAGDELAEDTASILDDLSAELGN